jgi:hypothetical protein
MKKLLTGDASRKLLMMARHVGRTSAEIRYLTWYFRPSREGCTVSNLVDLPSAYCSLSASSRGSNDQRGLSNLRHG